MTRKIYALDENPGKADEVAFLKAVADSLPRDSYLANLFTPDMIRWVEMQIANDVSANLYGQMMWQTNAKIADLAKKLEAAQNALREAQTKIQEYKFAGEEPRRMIDDLRQANDELHAQVAALSDRLADEKEHSAYQVERADKLAALLSQQEERIRNAKRQLEFAPMFADPE